MDNVFRSIGKTVLEIALAMAAITSPYIVLVLLGINGWLAVAIILPTLWIGQLYGFLYEKLQGN